jgi:glycosyltransferase
MKPLVSVITVSYNAANTVAATLDSVRAQTWRPLESVVVDGGSNDGTREIVARYADIAGAVVSEPDRGIYDAMNKGIALARGEILHFLNADDRFVDEGVVAEVAQLFAADPGLDLVFGDAIYLMPDGAFLRSYGRVTARNLIYGDLCHQVVFARKRVFDRFGGFNLDYRINADYDWMLRVFRGGARVRHLPRRMVYFRAGGQHMADAGFTEQERQRVRLSHTSPWALRAGMLAYRARRKLRTLRGLPELALIEP